MLNSEWKDQICYHGVSIGGSTPTWSGVNYEVHLEDDGRTQSKEIHVPWLKAIGVEAAISEHQASQVVLNTLVELVNDAGGYAGLSLAQTKLLDDAHEANLQTNASLPTELQIVHGHPFFPLNRMTVHARGFREDDLFQSEI